MVQNDPTCILQGIKNQGALAARRLQTSPHLKWTVPIREPRTVVKNRRFAVFVQYKARWDPAPYATSVCCCRLETSPHRPTLGCGGSLGEKTRVNKANTGAAAALPPRSCQHTGCMAETWTLGFQKLFVLHTFPRFPPSARWLDRLNPQPGHLAANLLVADIIVTITRFLPSSPSRHVLHTIRRSVFPPSPVSTRLFGCGEKHAHTHERWLLRDRSRLAWFNRVTYTETHTTVQFALWLRVRSRTRSGCVKLCVTAAPRSDSRELDTERLTPASDPETNRTNKPRPLPFP